MNTTRAVLLWAGLCLSAAGCNCGMPPTGEDAGVTGGGSPTGGGGASGGGGATGGGATGGGMTGGGGATGGGGGTQAGPNVVEFSSAAGRVSQPNGLTADVQFGIVPARVRASGGTITLEGSAVLQP